MVNQSRLQMLDEVDELYASGTEDGDREIVAVAHREFRQDRPDWDDAELARYARLAAYRSRVEPEILWQVRALETAARTGNFGSMALSLQPSFFVPLLAGDLTGAEIALNTIEMLSKQPSRGERPTRQLVDRIVAERRAFLLFKSGRFDEAERSYAVALSFAAEGTRGYYKVDGGRALAAWMSTEDSSAAANRFREIAERAARWGDVRTSAEANLAAAVRADLSGAVPFELL